MLDCTCKRFIILQQDSGAYQVAGAKQSILPNVLVSANSCSRIPASQKKPKTNQQLHRLFVIVTYQLLLRLAREEQHRARVASTVGCACPQSADEWIAQTSGMSLWKPDLLPVKDVHVCMFLLLIAFGPADL